MINFFISIFFLLIIIYLKNKFSSYKFKRLKSHNITNEIIDDMKKIAINSTGTIPNNPIFNYENKENKILLMIYKNNIPIGFNIMFTYKYKQFNCLHLGLTLIDKNYQGQKIKNFTAFNVLFFLIENFNKTFYISNLGRSSSSFKIFNKILTKSYPNFIHNSMINDEYKLIFIYFFNNFKEDTQISKIATYDINNFIIFDSNDSNGGSDYLITNNYKKYIKSSDDYYNELFYKNLKEKDDILSIGKISFFTLIINFFNIIKLF